MTRNYEECIASCRRVIAYEDAARAKGQAAMIRLWWKDPYVPWECRIVRCLVRMGRMDEARTTAKEAVAAIRVLLANPKMSRWTRREDLEATARKLDTFAAGGAFLE